MGTNPDKKPRIRSTHQATLMKAATERRKKKEEEERTSNDSRSNNTPSFTQQPDEDSKQPGVPAFRQPGASSNADRVGLGDLQLNPEAFLDQDPDTDDMEEGGDTDAAATCVEHSVMHCYIKGIVEQLIKELKDRRQPDPHDWLVDFLRDHGFWIRAECARLICSKLKLQ